MRHARLLPLAMALLCLVGCSFESADAAAAAKMETNACTMSSDCAGVALCMDGLCVAMNADAPLSIAIKVTPLQMPDGSDALPVLLDRFTIDESTERDFALPNQVTLDGRVRDNAAAIKAELSFTPITAIPGLRPTPVTVSTVSDQVRTDDYDYEVQLLAGVQYRMLVRPTDIQLPPYHRDIVASAGENVDVNYSCAAPDEDDSCVKTTRKTFTIQGAPTGRTLLVSAIDALTGTAISSTGSPEDGEVILSLTDITPFDLEIRAEESYTDGPGDALDPLCDTDTPDFPVFRIPSDALTARADGSFKFVLPTLPERIRYEGTVALCEGAMPEGMELTLPIALRSRRLVFDVPTEVTASFDVTTDAAFDPDSGKFRFCVQVMAGEYDVLVTPPPTMPCALFAEKRLVQAPEGMDAFIGGELLLPNAASLTGMLRTTDLAPLEGATVDAIALGRSDAIALAEGDASVTRYNRSQQTTTDGSGAFTVPVDLGSYDVVLKPPPTSGFPWQVRYDVNIGARDVAFAATIDMLAPLAISGMLHTGSGDTEDQASLMGAEIEAFAIIDDAGGSERALAIGKTTADAKGSFMLLLPPATYQGW